LNTKSKSFIEDTLILLLIGAILYGLYSFFFGSQDVIDNSLENPTIIEKNINTNTKALPFIEEKEQVVKEEQKKEQIQKFEKVKKEIKEALKEAIREEKKIKKVEDKIQITKEVTGPITIQAFYKKIKEKIYSNISKDVDKNILENLGDVNIRVTILKDGRYEQLKYMSGNRQHYNLIRPSILKIFPLEIDESLKYKFPRYFRMKVQH